MRNIQFSPGAFQQFIGWQKRDEKTFDKINELLREVMREPFKGLGKPEPLKGNLKGAWSRRITQEHRLVYRVDNDLIRILSCYGHYD